MKNIKTIISFLLLTVSIVFTNCNSRAQETLHDKKMIDWRIASCDLKLNTCMDFIRIWNEKQVKTLSVNDQKKDAIKLVECLDQGIKDLPKDVIDTMTFAQSGASCCQYVIYGSIK